jgi:hypothetical protein
MIYSRQFTHINNAKYIDRCGLSSSTPPPSSSSSPSSSSVEKTTIHLR